MLPINSWATCTARSHSPTSLFQEQDHMSSDDKILCLLENARSKGFIFDSRIVRLLEKIFEESTELYQDEAILLAFVSLAQEEHFTYDTKALREAVIIFCRYLSETPNFECNLLKLVHSKSIRSDSGILYFVVSYACTKRSQNSKEFFNLMIEVLTEDLFKSAQSSFALCTEFISKIVKNAFTNQNIQIQKEVCLLIDQNTFDDKPDILKKILCGISMAFCFITNVSIKKEIISLIEKRKFDLSNADILEKIISIIKQCLSISELRPRIFNLVNIESFGHHPKVLSVLFHGFQERIGRMDEVQDQIQFLKLIQENKFGIEKATLESIALKLILLDWDLENAEVTASLIQLIHSRMEISYLLIKTASVFPFPGIPQLILKTCFSYVAAITPDSDTKDNDFAYWLVKNLNWIQSPAAYEILSEFTAEQDSPFEKFLFLISLMHWKKEEVDALFSSPEKVLAVFHQRPENQKNYRLLSKGMIKLIQGIESKHITLSDHYHNIFSEMLKIDLGFSQSSIFDLIHGTDPLLSAHNAHVYAELMSYGIHAERALAYENKFDFFYKENMTPESVERLGSSLSFIIKEIDHIFMTYGAELKKYNRFCINLRGLGQTLRKQSDPLHWNTKIIQDFIDKLKKIEKELSKSNAPADHIFCISPLMEALDEFHSDLSRYLNTKNGYQFQIIQWDKNDPRTFFLGNHMGCCLALNNENFYAMIQRRLDDAIVFHVVMDQANHTPAAAVWLYFAKTEQGEIYLVGNFVEIGVHYGCTENESMRKAIIDQLLKFSERYSREIGIPKGHFIVNQLTYGLNQNHFSDAKPTENIELYDKVGGPYFVQPKTSPGDLLYTLQTESDFPQTTQEHYYLVSLENKKFHVIESEE